MSSLAYDRANLDLAINAVKKAGEYLRENFFDSDLVIESETGKDIKLAVDKGAEQIILEVLRRDSNISILSEEIGLIQNDKSNYLWIVDPLDGSLNYSRKIPINCISIGLWHNDLPVMGVIYDFLKNDLYCGDPDGATLNGSPINVSTITVKEKSVICTGFPSYNNLSETSMKNYFSKVKQYKKVRLLGSAAMSLALVSRGSAEAYTEESIGFWDVAAGIAILQSAGGRVDYEFVDKKSQLLNVYATNGVQSIL